MSNKRDLKAYVRYDGTGRVIAGSLILQRFKPKVGNWQETPAYECCNPEPRVVALRLTFDNIENASALVGDATSVSDWNTFFDLPAYGNPFTSVTIDGNTVILIGGSNIETKNSLFSDYEHLLEVEDNGSIVTLGDQTFGGPSEISELQRASLTGVTKTKYENGYGAFGGCHNLVYINLPNLVDMEGCEFYGCSSLTNAGLILPFDQITSLGDFTFQDCESITSIDFPNVTSVGEQCFGYYNLSMASLTSVNLPNLITAGTYCFYLAENLSTVILPKLVTADENCFAGCSSLTSLDLPELVTAKYYCFTDCHSLVSVNMPKLIFAEAGCFNTCNSLTNISFPELATIGDSCFYDCTSLTSLNIPVCTDLGGSVGNDGVFYNISGNTISLTVPSALMTCDAGNPDGDIVYLQANNTVTITTV